MSVFSLALNELRGTILRPAPLFLSIFIPFMLALVVFSIGVSLKEDIPIIEVAIVDEDQTFETKALVKQLSNEEDIQEVLQLTTVDEAEARTMFASGDTPAIIHIPADFTSSLRAGENTPLRVITNQHTPLQANMVELLLSSGSQYISASQSAVNTVYDLYLKDIPVNQRKERLQQTIITYTLFALNRNKAFDTEMVPSGTNSGWAIHLCVSVSITMLFICGLILQWLQASFLSTAMKHRLRAFHVTELQLYIAKSFKWLVVCSVCSLIASYSTFFFDVNSDVSIQQSLLFIMVGIFIASFLSCMEGVVQQPHIRSCMLLVIGFVAMGAGGVWIPSIYLPSYVETVWNPFAASYLLMENVLMNEPLSTQVIAPLIIVSLLLWMFGLLGAVRRERQQSYVPFFTSSKMEN
ncbi:ABC transporter permease [Pontibacillus litoralis]|uniref:ABC-2 type transporter transmembrane domain-containing protein n=1 Tax=Pontibacillus litoralis JSM 072002 TaxID=1385512 RepID=A0A0A5G8F2_9BACI|nr:ABC transporter permease [Pontibacillus litoralis]KGX87400.1 hypothetical protein N784_15725 [Pontibacillus litoralis JSM 072002]